MRVIGYTRVSTEEQAREGFGLIAQSEKLGLYAQLHGYELVETITDDGYSGKDLDRPGIQRALMMLRHREAAGLLIYKLDRLTRSLPDWGNLINRYFRDRAEWPSQLFSVQDHVDTSRATGRMMLNIIMTIAEWEREIIIERTNDAIAVKKSRGERTGKVPFGWDLDLAGPINAAGLPVKLIENPAEQAAIERMREWRAAGLSYRKIGEFLAELGIERKGGGLDWCSTPLTISRIIERAERVA